MEKLLTVLCLRDNLTLSPKFCKNALATLKTDGLGIGISADFTSATKLFSLHLKFFLFHQVSYIFC